jgi:adenosylhomocysteine nucleosidase
MAVQRSLLVSADRDLTPEETPWLRREFDAIAGDWESGAIAYVAARNGVRCLILRGVSDVVGEQGGEVYGDVSLWAARADDIMGRLFDVLPAWIALALA